MTNCYNCGHTGTFVLLVQFALPVPGLDTAEAPRADSNGSGDHRSDRPGDENADSEVARNSGGLSLAAQCPACESTDVGVMAEDLLASYRSRTTS